MILSPKSNSFYIEEALQLIFSLTFLGNVVDLPLSFRSGPLIKIPAFVSKSNSLIDILCQKANRNLLSISSSHSVSSSAYSQWHFSYLLELTNLLQFYFDLVTEDSSSGTFFCQYEQWFPCFFTYFLLYNLRKMTTI